MSKDIHFSHLRPKTSYARREYYDEDVYDTKGKMKKSVKFDRKLSSLEQENRNLKLKMHNLKKLKAGFGKK